MWNRWERENSSWDCLFVCLPTYSTLFKLPLSHSLIYVLWSIHRPSGHKFEFHLSCFRNDVGCFWGIKHTTDNSIHRLNYSTFQDSNIISRGPLSPSLQQLKAFFDLDWARRFWESLSRRDSFKWTHISVVKFERGVHELLPPSSTTSTVSTISATESELTAFIRSSFLSSWLISHESLSSFPILTI